MNEIGHALLHKLGISTSSTAGKSTHEALADVFGTFVEAKITSLDWCIGDDVPGGLDLTAGRWSIQGRNSTSFGSTAGMQGNVPFGGSCLQVNSIPTMPYYPQYLTIRYYNPGLNKTLLKRITLNDCDGDDPTCEDYYGGTGLQGVTVDDAGINPATPKIVARETVDGPLDVVVYDLLGNRISRSPEALLRNSGDRLRVVIFTYWDRHGNLVSTIKVLVRF